MRAPKPWQAAAGLLLWAFVALPLPLLAAQPPGSTATEAAEPPATASLNGQPAPALTDQNRASSLRLAAGDSLTLTAPEAFSQLYLVWDTPHAAYTLQTDAGGTQTAGEGGFLHDYTPLATQGASLTLTLAEGEATLCDAYLFAPGALPNWVQQWQPPLEKADLLALPTHADDEHLFFGGTLPYYAGEKGLDVQVAYLTNHWGEPYRPHELLNGLWEVGVRHYPLLSDFPDLYAEGLAAAEGLYDRQAVLAWQVENLRRFKPSVVLGHDMDGEYGHGVHMLNADTLTEALELAGDETVHPESAAQYGVWDTPKAYLHLWEQNQIVMDWSQPLSRFGGASALDVAKAGFAQHKSQQTYFAVEDFGPYDCRLFGLYRSTVGPDVLGGDFFENIPAEEPPAQSLPASSVASSPAPVAPAVSSAPMPASSAAPQDKAPTSLLAIVAALLALGLLALAVWLARCGKKKRKKRPPRR